MTSVTTVVQDREKELMLEGFELAEAALGLDEHNFGCHKWCGCHRLLPPVSTCDNLS